MSVESWEAVECGYIILKMDNEQLKATRKYIDDLLKVGELDE